MPSRLQRSAAPPTAAPGQASTRAWLWVLVVGGLLAATLPLCPSLAGRDLQFLLVSGGSVVAGALGLRRLPPRRRLPWALMLLGFALQWGGELVWAFNEVVLEVDPFPSPGDALFLAGVLCTCAGAVVLARSAGVRARARGTAYASPLAEVGVVGLAAALLIWRSVASPILDGAGSGALLATSISLAYPALDVLAIAVVARLVFGGVARNGARLLATCGLLALLFADVVFALQDAQGAYESGSWVDTCWLLAYVLTAAAARHPSAADPVGAGDSRVSTGRRLTLVLACGAVGPLLLLVDAPSHAEVRVTAVVTLVVLVLVLYRALTLLGAYQRTSADAAHLARHDALTGLPNRTQFVDLLTDALERADDPVTAPGGMTGEDGEAGIAVLRVDLDGFKSINDSAGHETGDAVLTEVAVRLGCTVPADASLARLSADEFAVLLPCATAQQVRDLSERVVAAVREPLRAGGREIWLRASVGSARSRAGAAGTDAVLGAADIALWTAKSRGGGRAVAHEDVLDADALHRPAVAARLQHAIDRDELEVHFQPLVDADSAVVGFEALVRWRRDGLLVSPAEFLPAAHSAGLIADIDAWVLDEALAQLARWRAVPGAQDLHIGVNMSVRSLQRTQVVDDVLAALARHCVPHDRLLVELTEEAAASAPEVRERLARLRERGVRVALDDFGTGYSSLAYLEGMPADILKIAKELVDPLAEDGGGRVVRALVGLAHSYGMLVIAEGVETAGQQARLLEHRVDWMQGYLFSRPVGAEAATDLWQASPRHRRPAMLVRPRGAS